MGDASLHARSFRGTVDEMAAPSAVHGAAVRAIGSSRRLRRLSPAQRWPHAAAVRRSENQDVGRPADDLAMAEKLSLGLEEAPAQPARSVDLGSRGQVGLDRSSAPDDEVAAWFPGREGERLARPSGGFPAQVVGGCFREADHDSAVGGVADAGVGGKVAEQVDPIDDVCHIRESIRGSRNSPATGDSLTQPTGLAD